MQPERAEILLIKIESKAYQKQDQLCCRREVARDRPKCPICIIDGLSKFHSVLKCDVQECVEVVQRCWVAILEPQKQTLLNDTILLGSVCQLPSELHEVFAKFKVIVHQSKIVVQWEAILEGDAERLPAILTIKLPVQS